MQLLTHFVLFMLFSILETSAIYFVTFRLFKFEVYIFSIIFASLIASFISYTMREVFGLASIDVAVQLFLVFAFIWQLYRTHPFYSALMAGVGFIGYVLMQTLLFFVLYNVGLLPESPSPDDISTYFLQTLSAATAFLIGYLIKKKNKGFTFVPYNSHAVKLSAANTVTLLLYIPALLLLALAYYIQVNYRNWFWTVPVTLLVIALLWIGLIYWSHKKEFSDD